MKEEEETTTFMDWGNILCCQIGEEKIPAFTLCLLTDFCSSKERTDIIRRLLNIEWENREFWE